MHGLSSDISNRQCFRSGWWNLRRYLSKAKKFEIEIQRDRETERENKKRDLLIVVPSGQFLEIHRPQLPSDSSNCVTGLPKERGKKRGLWIKNFTCNSLIKKFLLHRVFGRRFNQHLLTKTRIDEGNTKHYKLVPWNFCRQKLLFGWLCPVSCQRHEEKNSSCTNQGLPQHTYQQKKLGKQIKQSESKVLTDCPGREIPTRTQTHWPRPGDYLKCL